MTKQAVDAEQPRLAVERRPVVRQGRAQIALHMHDARLGQLRQHAVCSTEEFDRTSEADWRAVGTLDFACPDHDQIAGTWDDVDAVAWMEQP